MAQSEINPNEKKKNRLVPLVWLFGIGLTGGIITMGFLLSKKNKEVSGLEQQLTSTSITLNNVNDSLSKELLLANNNNVSLKSENYALSNSLEAQKDRNGRLASKYNSYVGNNKKCCDDYKNMLASVEQLSSENDNLKKKLADQKAEMEALQNKLSEREAQIAEQENEHKDQNDKMESELASANSKVDSVVRENKSRFINITELNGAYGINIVDVPYANYFYGVTNVSGLYVNKHFIAGIGIGVLAYNEGTTAPLYLDFRYHFSKRNFTPYLYADGGTIFKFDYLEEPMLFINPGVGLYKAITDKFAINMGLGLFIQRDERAKASFVNFKLGFVFTK